MTAWNGRRKGHIDSRERGTGLCCDWYGPVDDSATGGLLGCICSWCDAPDSTSGVSPSYEYGTERHDKSGSIKSSALELELEDGNPPAWFTLGITPTTGASLYDSGQSFGANKFAWVNRFIVSFWTGLVKQFRWTAPPSELINGPVTTVVSKGATTPVMTGLRRGLDRKLSEPAEITKIIKY